jgi:AbrB family looped-hinge helix DNA binding protein
MATTKAISIPTEVRLKVNENGRVVIPSEFRRALGIDVGDEVIFSWKDEEIRITTQARRLERAQRHVRKYVKPGVSLVDELIADRRREVARGE